jgi:hypothetical protein
MREGEANSRTQIADFGLELTDIPLQTPAVGSVAEITELRMEKERRFGSARSGSAGSILLLASEPSLPR